MLPLQRPLEMVRLIWARGRAGKQWSYDYLPSLTITHLELVNFRLKSASYVSCPIHSKQLYSDWFHWSLFNRVKQGHRLSYDCCLTFLPPLGSQELSRKAVWSYFARPLCVVRTYWCDLQALSNCLWACSGVSAVSMRFHQGSSKHSYILIQCFQLKSSN